MNNYKKHLINKDRTVKDAMAQLEVLAGDAIILFVVDENDHLLGSVTDGDVRRGLLRGITLNDPVMEIAQQNPKSLLKSDFTIEQVIDYRDNDYRAVPIVDDVQQVVNILNFKVYKSYLPVDAIIMAGGRGERLKPLTDTTPKSLLPIGDKPIIEHNIDQLIRYGIDDLWISVRYLGDRIESYFKDGSSKGANIRYIREDEALGTIGAASKAEEMKHDYVLVINSDVLTNLNYEDFFIDFLKQDVAMSILTIPYYVDIPYAILETIDAKVVSFKEKPTLTYYSNGGIYLMKRSCLDMIPKNSFFNATDLMDALIKKGEKISSYPLRGYWLDIGKHDDYLKAQTDIKHINF
jgi:dTDP-glucose pyrophosphorylase